MIPYLHLIFLFFNLKNFLKILFIHSLEGERAEAGSTAGRERIRLPAERGAQCGT